MSEWETRHLEPVHKMVRARVTGSHHKQRDTIKRWANLDGDVFTEAIDELVASPEAPVVEKARGTITLTSIQEAKQFIKNNDTEGKYSWFLKDS